MKCSEREREKEDDKESRPERKSGLRESGQVMWTITNEIEMVRE